MFYLDPKVAERCALPALGRAWIMVESRKMHENVTVSLVHALLGNLLVLQIVGYLRKTYNLKI